MNTMRTTFGAMLAVGAAFALSGTAAAQDAKGQPPPSAMPSHDASHDTSMHHDASMASGMHEMPATVLNVDHETGMVDVDSMNMKLKVHFPANTIADLKKGDKIKLHLGYSKQG